MFGYMGNVVCLLNYSSCYFTNWFILLVHYMVSVVCLFMLRVTDSPIDVYCWFTTWIMLIVFKMIRFASSPVYSCSCFTSWLILLVHQLFRVVDSPINTCCCFTYWFTLFVSLLNCWHQFPKLFNLLNLMMRRCLAANNQLRV